jgi:hypothetical protein
MAERQFKAIFGNANTCLKFNLITWINANVAVFSYLIQRQETYYEHGVY